MPVKLAELLGCAAAVGGRIALAQRFKGIDHGHDYDIEC
jgi:hypothetical protein